MCLCLCVCVCMTKSQVSLSVSVSVCVCVCVCVCVREWWLCTWSQITIGLFNSGVRYVCRSDVPRLKTGYWIMQFLWIFERVAAIMFSGWVPFITPLVTLIYGFESSDEPISKLWALYDIVLIYNMDRIPWVRKYERQSRIYGSGYHFAISSQSSLLYKAYTKMSNLVTSQIKYSF